MMSLTSATPLLLAPSISRTSRELPRAISRQAAHSPQGRTVGPLAQLRAFARIRAVVVLPTPRTPANRNAWAMRFCWIAWVRVRVTVPCPTRSSKTLGRYLSASTSYVIVVVLESRGPGCPRHNRDSAYRCSLPGLTGFVDSTRTGPEPRDTNLILARLLGSLVPLAPLAILFALCSCGGGGGIRTHGTVAGTLAFRASQISRSCTPPRSKALDYTARLFQARQDGYRGRARTANAVAASLVGVWDCDTMNGP